jgi:DNA-binding transcriptional LysR family regulator
MQGSQVELRQLEVFLEVVLHGMVTNSGRVPYVSPPAVTCRMAALKELGLKLVPTPGPDKKSRRGGKVGALF